MSDPITPEQLGQPVAGTNDNKPILELRKLTSDNQRLTAENNFLKQSISLLRSQISQLEAQVKSSKNVPLEVSLKFEVAKFKVAAALAKRRMSCDLRDCGDRDETVLSAIDAFIIDVFATKVE